MKIGDRTEIKTIFKPIRQLVAIGGIVGQMLGQDRQPYDGKAMGLQVLKLIRFAEFHKNVKSCLLSKRQKASEIFCIELFAKYSLSEGAVL